jgi:hypothetical protein
MATIDEFALKNICLGWRYRISRHWDEWTYIIIGRICESEIILIPLSLNISGSSSNGSYRNTDEVWWRYGISRSCDVWLCSVVSNSNNPVVAHSDHSIVVRRLTVDGAVLICVSLLYISISQADSAYYILDRKITKKWTY